MNKQEQKNRVHTIYEIMGLIPEEFAVSQNFPTAPAPPGIAELGDLPVAPVAEEEEMEPGRELVLPDQASGDAEATTKRFGTRDIARYTLVFFLALGFFYAVLNFRAVMIQVKNVFSPPEENQKVVLGTNAKAFDAWFGKYYVYVNDHDILAANEDADHDGLTNLDEFYVKTNPLKVDTDGDGFDDGREVLNGYNPLYAGRFTADQEKTVNENLDRTLISSRKAFQNVAGENTARDSYPIDVNKPGNLSIPRLDVNLPVIWSQEFARMEEDLKSGVAHHSGTPYPGERGTASIHGHSSGNPGDGNFKTAFTKINFLEPGDEVFVVVYGRDGTSRRYRYVVRSKNVYAKNDPKQFEDLGGYFMNLSTSWPIGTSRERYVVTTELVGL
ncbi:MAG: hypothetical protein A3B25_02685 [Candidatus Ryanbacteria bacterium RIFCSPLOWO2_01_FULL_48_26]|uniref:Uncharacterized protein n=1 Tax=Candidatus Ryanbacteria bacterium RIFCSPLOWO2_01_FULL_48_26 TaxID=1802126 RepID=A0A1G2GSW5_9BACT|nr:MAG: hypothetical protein A3B25_02685 [Candidatus Ryanbacteria bacterium RIFCSPLOWO2_01_FULL_48_26]